MVTAALALGGSERQMLATAEGLVALGCELEIFELNDVPLQFGVEDEFWKLGIPSWRAFDFSPELDDAAKQQSANKLARFASLADRIDAVATGAALRRAIECFRPCVVHCWSDVANIIGGLVAADLEVPRIALGLRSVPPPLTGHRHAALYRDGYRQLLSNSSVVMVSNSDTNRSSYERWLDLPPGTISLVRNGLSSHGFRVCSTREAAKCRARLGLPEGVPVVGAVMRFAAEKDPMLWLETAAAIAAQRPDTWFVLAGYGELAEHILTRVTELKLDERIVLPGRSVDADVVYAAIDVCLLTSLFEGLPNVLIEAQAAGRPVVAPRVGGAAEAFCPRKTGLLVEQRDPLCLAAAVLEILSDSDWRWAAAVYGPAFVAGRFAAARMIDETVEFYRLSLPGQRSGRRDVRAELFRHAASSRIAQLQTGIREIEARLAGERGVAEKRIRELEATLEAEHRAFVARIRELETDLEGERRASAEQIAEANSTRAAERDAAVKRIGELEATLEAEHHAFVARIRELEANLDGERRAHSEQIAKAQSTHAAERDAAVKRIRELEATLEAEHHAFVARIRELEANLDGERRAHGEQIAKAQSTHATERDAAVQGIREVEANLDAERRAHADQMTDAQQRYAADRAALVDRTRELEGALQAMHEALVKVSSIRGFRLGRLLAAIGRRKIMR
jgi:glycosyltransferase involved in cell wall biosynthesis